MQGQRSKPFLAVASLFTTLSLLVGTSSAQADPGSLDPTFGKDGIVTTAIGSRGSAAWAVAIQPNGKIISAGVSQEAGGPTEFALTRHNADGSPDTTFGSDGVVTTAIGSGAKASSIALQSDGKIVVAGEGSGDRVEFAIARYMPDGSLDPSFGAGGVVTTAVGDYSSASAVVLQPDGKIIAAGTTLASDAGFQPLDDFAVVRYNPSGSLDPSFGSGGVVRTDFNATEDFGNAAALQLNGAIVVAGRSEGLPTGSVFALARYNPDGSLDSSFGSGGKVRTAFKSGYADANAVGLQPDGKIVAAGYDSGFALARYNPDGSLDSSFGAQGKVTTTFHLDGNAQALVLQEDGKILAAGWRLSNGGSTSDFSVARYLARGSLDRYFGRQGKVTTSIDSRLAWATDLALQSDGKIVTVGAGGGGFALVRYLGGSLHCHVPALRGKRLARAKSDLRRANCARGQIRRRFSTLKRSRVISQRPRPGVVRPAGAKVRLVVSRGHRTRR